MEHTNPSPTPPWCNICTEFHSGPNTQECRDKVAEAADRSWKASERRDRVDRLRRHLEIGECLAEFLVGLQEQVEAQEHQIATLTAHLDRAVKVGV